jgi:hypothetical protein
MKTHLLALAAMTMTMTMTMFGLTTLALPAQTTPAPDPAPQQQQATTPTPQPAPSAQQSTAQANATPRIAPGSVLPVRLTKSVDAKKAKVGEEVEAKVTQDMKTGSGEVLVPKDTTVIGHVTEAQPRSKEQKESQVGLAFDHAVMNGGSVPLPMSIQAVIAPPGASQSNSDAGSQAAVPSSAPGGAGGTSAQSSSGHAGTMSPATPPQVPTATGAAPASGSQSASNAPAITGNTQGVVGISNLKLSAATDATQGSLLISEKNNVKLDSGTLMLLKVNP